MQDFTLCSVEAFGTTPVDVVPMVPNSICERAKHVGVQLYCLYETLILTATDIVIASSICNSLGHVGAREMQK